MEGWKVAFWNVAGLGSKDKDFWEGMKEWDVLVMSETWVHKKRWVKIREWLPREYEWTAQMAKRKNRKGRAMGGMIMGIRRELMEEGVKMETEKEELMVGRVKRGKERWRIVGVYIKARGRWKGCYRS